METAMATEMATAIAMATAMETTTIKKGGLPLYVLAMCSAVAGATPCLHPHGHKGVCIHHRCTMGVILQRVFAPFQGGGFLTAHHGLFFLIFYNYYSVYWTTLCLPPALFRRSRTLSAHWRSTPYILHSSKNPVSLLMMYLGSYWTFCQGKPGQGLQWLYHYYYVLMWNDQSLINLLYFPNFSSVIDRAHQIHLKTPCCDSWDLQVKVYLAVSRHYPAQPSCRVLVLAFAWQLFSSLHLHLAPFLGSWIVLRLHNWSSKILNSTVLDSAKPFGQICFFCFYLALLIFSPRVHLKERVVEL